jgi:hypothetical protein
MPFGALVRDNGLAGSLPSPGQELVNLVDLVDLVDLGVSGDNTLQDRG